MRYRVAKHKRGFVCIIYEGRRRRRVALEATNKWQATAEAGELVADIKRRSPKQVLTVGQIVEQYLEQSEAIWKEIDRHHWKAAKPVFGGMVPGSVTEQVCKTYAADRKAKPGTIRKELGLVRTALSWAKKQKPPLIDAMPDFWFPAPPPPRDRRLTRDEAVRLIDGCAVPHVKLFVIFALNSAGRAGALLALRWVEVDLEKRRINLGGAGRQKGRATIPINDTLHAALTDASKAAMTPFVIEWAGGPVKSVKRSFREAVKRAGLGAEVTPHVLRHTAASWMAEKGVSMDEIAQFLGHSSPSMTYKIYARFSPDFLQKAAKALG